MTKLLYLLVLFGVIGVVLHLNTLDEIYVGVYTEGEEKPELKVFQPDSYVYELEFPLGDGQVAYYFYNLGFGKIES